MGKPFVKPGQGDKNSLGKGEFETFNSGDGPLVPESAKGDFDDRDGDLHCDGADDVEHGAVPELPQKKR